MEAFFAKRVGEITTIDAKQDKRSIEHSPLKPIILVSLFPLFPLFCQGFLLRLLCSSSAFLHHLDFETLSLLLVKRE